MSSEWLVLLEVFFYAQDYQCIYVETFSLIIKPCIKRSIAKVSGLIHSFNFAYISKINQLGQMATVERYFIYRWTRANNRYN